MRLLLTTTRVRSTSTSCWLICLLALILVGGSCLNSKYHRGVVTIHVSVDKDGRQQPVTGESFYLVRSNPIDLLGGNSKDAKDVSKLADLTALAVNNSDPHERTRVQQAISKNSETSFRTDAQGEVKFPPVFIRTYYIVGWTRVGQNQLMIWNQPVEIERGEKNVVLNPSNAALVATIPSAPTTTQQIKRTP